MGLNLAELTDAVTTHGPVTRVLIAHHSGSTPRETGTSMLVWDSGQSGTIGGGALELQAIDLARKTVTSGAITIPLGPALGQCCGGSVTLILEPFTAQNLPAENQPFLRHITGNADQPLALRRALKTARNSGQPTALHWHSGWLLEPLDTDAEHLWLYGAGHVGRAIVNTLNDLPFHITWVDTAPDRFPQTIPANATQFITDTPAAAVKYAPDSAHHIVLTYSHALDLDLCHAVLSRPHATLGLIGSATKRARFTKRLAALGHAAPHIAKMICPIGNRALGKHPQAIAIGVASKLIRLSAHETAQNEATA